ncbi:MAG: ATPase [Rhodothermales bacterium]
MTPVTPDASRPQTILCIASYFKGGAFLEECKRQGCRVLLVTSDKSEHDPWPWDSIDDVFYVPGDRDRWHVPDLVKSVSYLARTEVIDRIVALDDFDVEKGGALREHLRVPGMGDTRTRYFRDKLAMRVQARDEGIPVPPFVHVLNHAKIYAYTEQVPAPWVLKPRSQASAMGIKKVHSADQLWPLIEEMGDEQSFFLLEQFVPGDIYHVDSVVYDHEVVFARASRYLDTPMSVAQDGGIFRSQTVEYGTAEEEALLAMNADVMKAMGLWRGVSHTEFIRAHADGQFYFLETSSRVGGANIAEMVEAASGVNLWQEWARIETLPRGQAYEAPETRQHHAGIIVSLARQEHPDTSAYNDAEIIWRMDKKNHAGLIVQSESHARVKDLLDGYTERFYADFHASVPLGDSAPG